MPLYVYADIDSGERTEVRHSIHDDALTEIEGRPVRRVPFGGVETAAFVGRFSLNENVQNFFATGDPGMLDG